MVCRKEAIAKTIHPKYILWELLPYQHQHFIVVSACIILPEVAAQYSLAGWSQLYISFFFFSPYTRHPIELCFLLELRCINWKADSISVIWLAAYVVSIPDQEFHVKSGSWFHGTCVFFFLFVVVVLSWWEPNDPRMIEVLRTFVESQPYPHDQIESKGTWTSTALNHVLELFSLRSQTEVLYEFLEYNINTSKHLQSLDNFIVSYIYCKLMNSPKISLY